MPLITPHQIPPNQMRLLALDELRTGNAMLIAAMMSFRRARAYWSEASMVGNISNADELVLGKQIFNLLDSFCRNMEDHQKASQNILSVIQSKEP